MIKKRVDSIDIAKGIGILLVIWGHLTVDGQVSRFAIFTFHMPLFFMLSGIFEKSNKNIAEGGSKILRTLLVPYLFIVTIDFIPRSLTALNDGKFDLVDQIITAAKCAVGLKTTYNRALWFLFVLFIIKALFLLLGQIRNKTTKDSVIITLSTVSVVFILTRQFMDLRADCLYISALGCFVFYSAGYYLQDIILNIENSVRTHKIHLFTAPVAIAAVFLIVQTKEMFIVHTYKYTKHPLLMLIAAVCGCYVTLVISAIIANSKADRLKKVLLFYGKNSIIILMLHYPVARNFYPSIFEKIGLKGYLYNPIAELILFAITALMAVPAIYLFNKYLYFIIGKKKPTR